MMLWMNELRPNGPERQLFSEKIRNRRTRDIYHERAGIYAEFGKIICIAVGKFIETESGELGFKTKAYYGDKEAIFSADLKT